MRLLTTLLLSASLLSTPAMAQELRAIRSITVSGQAERLVVPDEAHITVNLNAQDKDMAKARAAHQQKLTKLLDIVKKAGIDEKKVRSQSSNIQPIYDYRNDGKGNSQRIFLGYRAQTNLDITVGDTAKLGGLMDSISSAGFEQGANTEWGNLLSVYYTISKPDEVRDALLADAITNAKTKAERMADAAGAELGKVYQLNENGTPQFQPVMLRAAAPMMAKAESAMADAAPPAGEQKIESSVTVTFELK